jgi:hypothetical protein
MGRGLGKTDFRRQGRQRASGRLAGRRFEQTQSFDKRCRFHFIECNISEYGMSSSAA